MSQSDGDCHFLDARRLMMLWNVRPEECVVLNHWPSPDERKLQDQMIKEHNLLVLGPRYHGDYDVSALRAETGPVNGTDSQTQEQT